jgi:succinate dehydrogenase / fumarate reductase, membrane anchor subunit
MTTRSSLRSPLGVARGLGSAKDGTAHWWAHRLTAIALVPLTIWFVASLAALAGAPYHDFRAWVGQPLVAVFLLVLLGTGFYHLKLGLQVVIEDYIHGEGAKLGATIAVNFATVLVAIACIFSVLKIAI